MEPALLRNSPAHPSALLISVHISLKGDLSPFTVGFLPSGFAPPEASVDDKAGRNRRGKSLSQEWRDKEKKSRSPLNANMVFLKHSINPSCPPCQAQMGNGKGDIIIIMSHSCRFKHPDDILQNKQRSRARPGGLAVTSKTRSWRERIQRKCAVLVPGSAAASASLSSWDFQYWMSDGRRGGLGTVYVQAPTPQGPSIHFCQCLL